MALGEIHLGLMYTPEFIRGRALFGAQIYIGTIHTNPSNPANQKQVTLQHSGNTFTTVDQPIICGAGGVPSYNGSPARMLVDGDYSILVNDRLGTEVYYLPDLSVLGEGSGGGSGECCDRWGSTTVTAGAGGDYPGLNEALTALSNTGKRHDPGTAVIVNILASTTIPTNIIIDSVDLSWIEIQSDDATVTVSSAGLTGGLGFWVVQNGADSPTIGCTFVSDAAGAGGHAGLYVDGAGSTAGILPTKGFQSFTSSALAIDGGVINARAATTTGSTGDAFSVTDGGVINATGASGTHSQAANILYPEGIIYHDSGPPDYMPVQHHADAATAEAASIADGGVALHVSPGEHVDDEYTIGNNANGYYRIRNADGYIEQWGALAGGVPGNVQLTLPVAFGSIADFEIQTSWELIDTQISPDLLPSSPVSSKHSTTSFNCSRGSTSEVDTQWRAYGY